MKPAKWDKLPTETKRILAGQLHESLRGRYIISQALALGIRTLKAVPEPRRERSNIEDMEMLREMLFAIPIHVDGVGII